MQLFEVFDDGLIAVAGFDNFYGPSFGTRFSHSTTPLAMQGIG